MSKDTYPVVVENDYGVFEHGELSVSPGSSYAEQVVEAKIHLVTERTDYVRFKKELEELIAKYAL